MAVIGEIIETSSIGFVAESFELNQPPPLGSLVRVRVNKEDLVYGVVSFGTTASPDPGRRAVRRSTEEVHDEAIYDEHPQLRHILRTEFSVHMVGCRLGDEIRHHLPPQPPPLHYSVHTCPANEVSEFTEHLTYLRLLLSATGEVPIEQLLAAHIREVYRARGMDEAWLERAAREVAGLLKRDAERLLTVLYAIEPGP